MTVHTHAPTRQATVYDCGTCGAGIFYRNGQWQHFTRNPFCQGITIVTVHLTLRRWP